jgi:hypothetical protein
MKTPQNRKGMLLATLLLGSCLASPTFVSAQEAPPSPPAPVPTERGRDGGKAEERMERGRKPSERLRQSGRHEQARGAEIRLHGNSQRKAPRGPQADGGAPIQKIRHLQQAATHLKAAGYPRQAEMALVESKRLQTRIHEETQQRRKQEKQAREMKQKKAERPKMEAKKRAGDGAGRAGIEGEMKKMRREMEELRQQIRRMKADRQNPKNFPDSSNREAPIPPPAPAPAP